METLEAFVCWNFVMDALVCAAAALACGREKGSACIVAAGLGTVYAAAARVFPGMAAWPFAALAGAVMALIAVRPRSLAVALRAIGALYAAGLFAGGAQLLLGQKGSPVIGAAAAALAGLGMDLWLVRSRRMRLHTWDVQLVLRTGSGCVRFRALVDTGNRLHEPISGLPVMIVEENALRRVLPTGFDAGRTLAELPPGWRMVAYGVLGSAGRMPCFRPEGLMVCSDGRWLSAPDIWVAVYPGRIPGQIQALAPTVIGTVRPAQGGAAGHKTESIGGQRA